MSEELTVPVEPLAEAAVDNVDWPVRALTFADRLTVCGCVDMFVVEERVRDAVIDAVRCCDNFPECSHVLAWVEGHDAIREPASAVPQPDETTT